MRRRKFIALLGGTTIGWPLVAAQQASLPVVGFLNSASAQGYASMAAAFKQGLKESGYSDGRNVTIEYRWADDNNERLPAFAADLASRRVDVIFANSPSIAAALAATKTIPIIFNSGDDPVRLGFVASLNRPGGNATGVTIFSNELAAKRLDFLRELVPHSKSIAVLINLDFGPSARFRADVEAAARALGLAAPTLQASNPGEIETAFNNLAQTRPDALLVGPGPFLDSHRDLLVFLAAKISIPAGYETRASALAGGLEPISKSSEEDEEAGELHEAKEVLRIKLPADKNATLPLYPGEEAFNQPAPGISPKPSSILRGALAAIGSVRRDHLDAVFA